MPNQKTNIDSQGNVYYSDPDYAATQGAKKELVWGVDDIVPFEHTGEGVFAGMQPDGTSGWWTSRTVAKTIDLIGEGEIEGLVTGEYIPDDGEIGDIGYPGYKTVSYGKEPECFLRSISLNDTPVVGPAGYYNFANVEVAFTNGTPSGIREGDEFLNIGQDSNNIEKTRLVNERLLGPDVGDSEATPPRTPENPFLYNSKSYRIRNRELEKVKINIKIAALFFVKQGEEFKTGDLEKDLEILGSTVGASLKFYVRWRPIYQLSTGVGENLNKEQRFYPVNGPIDSSVYGIIRANYLHPIVIDVTKDEHYPDGYAAIATSELTGWEIEITRLTLESIQSNIQNQSYIDSLTEIYSSTMSYPNSALVAMNFNAQYFGQIPTRSFDMRLLKVQIPNNYDPIQKSYSLDNNDKPNWDGTMNPVKQWTDNPAWVYYDLLTNRRYGLGKYVNKLTIDKWTLYEIAKFCDTLVPDEFGGTEPRFACNAYINTREEAYNVLQDFASVFRGITYYGLGNLHAVQDKRRDPIAQFANANVVDGNFTYSSSSKKTRNTVCVVRYNDRENGYKPALEYVEDTEGIRKYGYIEKEVTAFACTSKTQAIRLGRWILTTELYESELCNFSTGPEASLLRPGDVIKITDENRYETASQGRVVRANPTGVVLDRTVELLNSTTYDITLTTPTFFYDSSIVDTESSSFGEHTVNTKDIRRPYIQSTGIDLTNTNYNVYPELIGSGVEGERYGTVIQYDDGTPNSIDMFNPASGAIMSDATWSIRENIYEDSLYSVISIKESSEMQFQVETMLHRPDKFEAIDKGVPLDQAPSYGGVTVVPPNPARVTATGGYLWRDGKRTNTKRIKIEIERPRDAQGDVAIGNTVGYKIYIKRLYTDSSSSTSTFDADDLLTGNIPKDEFSWTTIYVSEQANQDPLVYFLPERNRYRYIVRVFAVNGTALYSAGYEEDQATIEGHYPVRDIRIHSLRLFGSGIDESGETPLYDPATGEPNVDKQSFGKLTSKDALLTWDVDFPLQEFKNLDLFYRISIHEVNPVDATPISFQGKSTGYKAFDTNDRMFNFSFENNLLIDPAVRPVRHFDAVVRAIDIDGNSSAGNNGTDEDWSTVGWDIIELDNPKPDNYHLTPRSNITGRPGLGVGDEKMTTSQYLDADGTLRLRIIQSEFQDLAGGFLYLSAHPFSGKDFYPPSHALWGEPNNESRKDNLCEEELQHKQGQFQILTMPFQRIDFISVDDCSCAGDSTFIGPEIKVHPNSIADAALDFDFQNTYYMAASFYDSFTNSMRIKYEENPALYPELSDWKTGLWLGFVRHHTGYNGEVKTLPYQMYEDENADCGNVGEFLADLEVRDDCKPIKCYSTDYNWNQDCSGIFSCPIHPSKYYSSNAENGFKYWIRMNVNGQWEGNGISVVKAMSWADVTGEYQYEGFWEFACIQDEYTFINSSNNWEIWPNDDQGIARCRFRQGTFNTITNEVTDIDGDIAYNPTEQKYVTGSVRLPDASYTMPGSPYHEYYGPRAGVPLKVSESHDRIDSYNEFGQAIAGRDRPKFGYRRFRVFFDPAHLPPAFQENQLPSYTVIGINAWNGPYEAWPGTTTPGDAAWENSLLLAKDGTAMFPESVRSWIREGDLFENIPGVWNHHPAGFGQGFGGLKKTQRYFDIHMGRMIDDSYLNEGFFAVVTANDYSILEQEAQYAGTDLHTHAHRGSFYIWDPDGNNIPGDQS